MNKKFDECGVNRNTCDLLFKDKLNLSKDEQGDAKKYDAFMAIDKFTRLQEKRIFTSLLKFIYKNIIEINFDKIFFNKQSGQYEYRDNDLVISFDKLSNYIDDKNLRQQLMSSTRYGKCHNKSLTLAPSIKGSKVVTGYCTMKEIRFLHSVIEYMSDGEVFVIDWTKNLIMQKNEYVELTKFVEISSIEGNKIVDDFEMIVGNLDVSNKMYVVFRDELIRDMKRNAELFKTTDEGRRMTEWFNSNKEINLDKKMNKRR